MAREAPPNPVRDTKKIHFRYKNGDLQHLGISLMYFFVSHNYARESQLSCQLDIITQWVDFSQPEFSCLAVRCSSPVAFCSVSELESLMVVISNLNIHMSMHSRWAFSMRDQAAPAFSMRDLAYTRAPFCGRLEAILGPSRGHLGAILWPYRPSRGHPGSILRHFRVTTSEDRRCIVAFVVSSGHLGAILESP